MTDNNFIVHKIIDILNSNNRNLVLGNISNPRPNSICPVNTRFGMIQAYNINCTYPGEAVVVWDKDENRYYCFTTKPSEILDSKKLIYRKNRPLDNKVAKGRYILIMDTNFSPPCFNRPLQESNTNIFFEKALHILNSKYNKLYIAIGDSQNNFFGHYLAPFFINMLSPIWNYLMSKNKQVIFVKDTELDTVDDIFWMPLFDPVFNTSNPFSLSKKQIKQIENIASKYGVILQGEWANWTFISNYYLDIFYNKYNKNKLRTDYLTYNLMYSNLSDFRNRQINSYATGYVVGEGLKDKNILAYTYPVLLPSLPDKPQIPITTVKYSSIIYWNNS